MDKAVVALIILAVVIVFLILEFVPSAATVICGCVAMVIFGVCDVETVAGGLSNDLVLIIFGMGIIGAAVQASGAAEFVGKTVARLARGNERLMIVGLALIAAAFSAFMNSTIVSAMMLTICMGVASGNSSTRLRNLSMPVIIGTIMGGTLHSGGSGATDFRLWLSGGSGGHKSGIFFHNPDWHSGASCRFAVHGIYRISPGAENMGRTSGGGNRAAGRRTWTEAF